LDSVLLKNRLNHNQKAVLFGNVIGNEKGSFTIEAVLVVSVVFILLIFTVLTPFRLYSVTYNQVMADLAAQRGAAVWNSENRDIDTGKKYGQPSALYWRIYDGKKDVKVGKIKEWLLSRLTSNPVISRNLMKDVNDMNDISKAEEIWVKVSLRDLIIFKTLEIEAGGNFPGKTVYARSCLTEPAEFIRNADFAAEAAAKMESYFPQIKNTSEKIGEIIEGIMQDIKSRADEGW